MARACHRLIPLGLCALLSLSGCNSLFLKQQPQPATGDTTAAVPEAAFVKKKIKPLTDKPELIARELEQEPLAEIEEAPIDDLWARLRNGYRLEIPDNPRIERELQWYASHTDYLARVQERAAPYFHFILEEAEKRGVPSEIALLPIVESAFKPFAYSPGRAAGLWQFIPSTGRHFGLEQNWWYDGRRDVVASTRAAFDYLSGMAEEFDGDWELALAGYNAGAGNVRRAIKRNTRQGKATDYWSLDLPKETMNYVPRLLAVAKIFNDPDAYGLDQPSLPNIPHFEIVDIESQLDLAMAAEMAGLSIEEIYQLNPGFNRWATAPGGPHRLALPVEKAELFSERLSGMEPEQRLQWKRYRIRPGDNLGSIARKNGTTVALLQQINKLKGNNIRAGKHLLIPVASQQMDSYSFSQQQRLAKTQNRERKGSKVIHRVRAGDTLWQIARSHNISHKALAKWNGMAPGDTLRLGQKLVIWTSESQPEEAVTLSSPLDQGPATGLSSVHYRVRKGDSLARIAQRFKVSVNDLRKWNPQPDKYLQPGQRLRLYVDVTEQTL
jgi:membrane-bound lytic murein transglycosylase D